MKLQFLLMADPVIVKRVLTHVWPAGRVVKKASGEVSMGLWDSNGGRGQAVTKTSTADVLPK